MTRPRVLQILHSLEIGGAEKVAAAIAKELCDRFDFHFACLDGLGPLAEELQREGIRIDYLGREDGFDRALVRKMRRLIVDHPPDVVHAHQCTPWTYFLLARGWRSAPVALLTEHGRFHPDSRSWRRTIINRALMRASDSAIAVGQSVAEALRLNEGMPAARIGVIYNGVDLERFGGGRRTGDGAARGSRRDWGIDDDSFVVSIAARLDPIKDHLTAIRSMAWLNARQKGWRLLIAGEGPERATLEREIGLLGLEENVRMLGTVDDVPALLEISDVACLSSLSEGIPLFLIEAMACGVPVVATRVGGIPEVVTAEEQGLLVEARDPEQLGMALERLRTDSGLHDSLSEAGPLRARQRFSLEAMLASYANLYERSLGERAH